MEDVLVGRPERRLGWIPRAVIASLVTAVVVGGVCFYVGHEVGERNAQPSANVRYEQQADVIDRLEETNRRLIEIEQSTLELLVERAGADVDTAAFLSLRTQYTQAYDVVLDEVGRIHALFSAKVLGDARDILRTDNIALNTLYVSPSSLAQMTAEQIDALIKNSHSARKHQFEATRTFMMDATTELLGED